MYYVEYFSLFILTNYLGKLFMVRIINTFLLSKLIHNFIRKVHPNIFFIANLDVLISSNNQIIVSILGI